MAQSGNAQTVIPDAASLREVLARFQDALPHVATGQIVTTILPLIALLAAMHAGWPSAGGHCSRWEFRPLRRGADLYHSTRLRPRILLPRARRQRPSRAVMLAADADPLLPVAAPQCETPRCLEQPRPSQRPRARHILVLPHGRQCNALGTWRRRLHRTAKHPAISLLVRPPLIFLVLYRFPFAAPRTWRAQRRSVHLTNLSLVALHGLSRRCWKSAQWRRCSSPS